MDADIYSLAGKYGFKAVHYRLLEIMRQEYECMRLLFDTRVIAPVVSVPVASAPVVSVPVASVPVVSVPVASVPVTSVPIKPPRKSRVKKELASVEQNEIVSLSLPTDIVEVKDIIVNVSEKGFRDPKEVRDFQKSGEEATRKQNEAAGVQLFQILTKENLKKWIEDEGHTYSWVAREKAGCADTQVAATAQMMGITSKISKKRGMIIGNKKF